MSQTLLLIVVPSNRNLFPKILIKLWSSEIEEGKRETERPKRKKERKEPRKRSKSHRTSFPISFTWTFFNFSHFIFSITQSFWVRKRERQRERERTEREATFFFHPSIRHFSNIRRWSSSFFQFFRSLSFTTSLSFSLSHQGINSLILVSLPFQILKFVPSIASLSKVPLLSSDTHPRCHHPVTLLEEIWRNLRKKERKRNRIKGKYLKHNKSWTW